MIEIFNTETSQEYSQMLRSFNPRVEGLKPAFKESEEPSDEWIDAKSATWTVFPSAANNLIALYLIIPVNLVAVPVVLVLTISAKNIPKNSSKKKPNKLQL